MFFLKLNIIYNYKIEIFENNQNNTKNAEITYETIEQANYALREMNNKLVLHNQISIKLISERSSNENMCVSPEQKQVFFLLCGLNNNKNLF